MSKFEIQAIQEECLPEIADFFVRWRKREEQNSAAPTNGDSNPQRIESADYLRWLLVENPARDGDTPLGYCVRDRKGAIVGAILTFPSYFAHGGKRLKGLCGASIFVNEEARIQGFIIFKKFLSTAGQDFFFSTTCNPDSGALWTKFRGRGHAIPNSGSTYILPFRIERLLEAFAENRNFHPGLVALLRTAGKIGSAIVATKMKSSAGLSTEPCRNWEQLAELATMHRNPEWITNERSAKFLEWRYGRALAGDSKELYRFSDKRGSEGWFAIASGLLGRQKKIRVTEVLDIVWPRKTVDPREIVATLAAKSMSSSDALYMRPRNGVALKGFSRLVLRSRYQSPQCYVMAASGNGNLQPAHFDFVAADGDSWP